MKLSDRVDHIEVALVKHLEESGEIRSDLKWLKKAFWALTSVITTCFAAVVAAWVRAH